MLQMQKFKPDRAEIQRMLHGRDGMVSRDMIKRARRVQVGAQRQVGVRSGRLLRSIKVEAFYRPKTGAYIGSGVRYAMLHHEGTRPHIIAPQGRVLTFTSKGRRVHARKVLHPGTKPNRFLTDNLINAIR